MDGKLRAEWCYQDTSGNRAIEHAMDYRNQSIGFSRTSVFTVPHKSLLLVSNKLTINIGWHYRISKSLTKNERTRRFPRINDSLKVFGCSQRQHEPYGWANRHK